MYKHRAALYITTILLLLEISSVVKAQNPTLVYADTTAPITNYTQTPSSPDGKNGWYKSIVNFALQATDLESGVKQIKYKIDTKDWVSTDYSQTLNLVQNPSFEQSDASSLGVSAWDITLPSGTNAENQATYTHDTSKYAPGFDSASISISSTEPSWHSINNRNYFAVASYLDNMSSSVWLRTQDVSGTAYYKVMGISQDAVGTQTVAEIGTSPTLAGNNNWTKISLDFSANLPDIIGVYLEIGLNGTGTVWVDAASIDSSYHSANINFAVAHDSTSHTVQFYSVDQANNSEPVHTISFKQDITPPGNWHGSGAIRGLFGSDHELYVYTNISDSTSGISTFTDRFSYNTETNPGYGRFSNLLSCASTWKPNETAILVSPPFLPGVKDAFLITPKTDFCNSNWHICKTVRFYAEDLAGNIASKDYCLNGPWIKVRGEGITRSNDVVNMVSEADEDNTDGLIETRGNMVSFYTSSRDWVVTNAPDTTEYSYDKLKEIVQEPQSANSFTKNSGVFEITGDYTIAANNLPSQLGSTTFNQILFINGDLTIDKDIQISEAAALLFVVKGNVRIQKNVSKVTAGIFADGNISTAYDLAEDQVSQTLALEGLYKAQNILFQRTLQGTNNNKYPSEDITFKPKYIVQLKDYFKGYNDVKWEILD